MRLMITVLTLGLLTAGAAKAQTMDATFAQHVQEWTTKPEFISPLVDHLPAAPR